MYSFEHPAMLASAQSSLEYCFLSNVILLGEKYCPISQALGRHITIDIKVFTVTRHIECI